MEDPSIVAVVANFFDLEKAIAADPDVSHDKLSEVRRWAGDRQEIFTGMTGELPQLLLSASHFWSPGINCSGLRLLAPGGK